MTAVDHRLTAADINYLASKYPDGPDTARTILEYADHISNPDDVILAKVYLAEFGLLREALVEDSVSVVRRLGAACVALFVGGLIWVGIWTVGIWAIGVVTS